MYLGAVIALKDELDPERLCKATHQMRELMENISEIMDVEIRALNERMAGDSMRARVKLWRERSTLSPKKNRRST